MILHKIFHNFTSEIYPRMNINLQRYLEAQESQYQIALSEIKSGRKRSHWMWYIFPQLQGLGQSPTSEFYGIKNIEEGRLYLNHPILGLRLKEITNELLYLKQTHPKLIFGRPDYLKLRSSMTLFFLVDEVNGDIFKKVIDKFFYGCLDTKTQNLLINSNE